MAHPIITLFPSVPPFVPHIIPLRYATYAIEFSDFKLYKPMLITSSGPLALALRIIVRHLYTPIPDQMTCILIFCR